MQTDKTIRVRHENTPELFVGVIRAPAPGQQVGSENEP